MTSKTLSSIAALLLVFGLSACATTPTDPAGRAEFDSVNDPLEPANRVVFEFNQILDRVLLKPAAQAYRYVMPDFAQKIVGNVLSNAEEPVRMGNALLQGRVTDAHKIFNRFLVNTTAGLGGMIDMGSESDLPPVRADFGQTLHVWGAPSGPYLVLPLLGPSNPRDAIGFAVDSVAQPYSYIAREYGGVATENRYTAASLGATLLDKRAGALDALDALEKGSLDFYAQLRSVSTQYRNKQLGITQAASDYDSADAPGKEKKKFKKKKKKAAPKPAAALTPAAPVAVMAESKPVEPAPVEVPKAETVMEAVPVTAPVVEAVPPAAPATATAPVVNSAPVVAAPPVTATTPAAVATPPAHAEVPEAAPVAQPEAVPAEKSKH